MMFILIGLFIIACGFYYRKDFPKLYLFFIALGILCCVYDLNMIIQGEMVKSYYNNGTGVVYRQHLINETTNSTYSVDHVYYSFEDPRVGEYMEWKKANDRAFVFIGYVMQALIVLSVIVIFYFIAKKFYLIN